MENGSVNEKLDHIPSSCIVLVMHNNIKVRTQSTSHIDTSASIESETDSRPRQGQVSIGPGQCSTSSELQIGRGMKSAIERKASFIYTRVYI